MTMKTPVNIRMPDDMKRALEKMAESEFRSINSVILQYLDEQLKSKGINWRKEDSEETEET